MGEVVDKHFAKVTLKGSARALTLHISDIKFYFKYQLAPMISPPLFTDKRTQKTRDAVIFNKFNKT